MLGADGCLHTEEHPLMRIITLGEFALERLVPTPSRTPGEQAHYVRVERREWSNRGPAMALLKVLLCRAALPHQNLPLSVPSSFSPWLPVTLPRGHKRADDLWPNQYASAILLTKGRGS